MIFGSPDAGRTAYGSTRSSAARSAAKTRGASALRTAALQDRGQDRRDRKVLSRARSWRASRSSGSAGTDGVVRVDVDRLAQLADAPPFAAVIRGATTVGKARTGRRAASDHERAAALCAELGAVQLRGQHLRDRREPALPDAAGRIRAGRLVGLDGADERRFHQPAGRQLRLRSAGAGCERPRRHDGVDAVPDSAAVVSNGRRLRCLRAPRRGRSDRRGATGSAPATNGARRSSKR